MTELHHETARLERMREAVSGLYDRNRQRGYADWCDRDFDFVCPSKTTYPFQWFWDSCFHAIVLSRIEPVRAESELTCLLANQQPDGLVPHVTFWQREAFEPRLADYSIAYRTPYFSDCMQPPALAEAIAAVATHGRGESFLREVLPAARRYFDWLHDVRDPDRDGLIAVLQADETGLDESPKFDEYLGVSGDDRPDYDAAWHRVADPYAEVGRDPTRMFSLDRFIDEDVMVNTIYAENQRVLAELLAQVGDAAGAADFAARAVRTREALVTKCWDADAGLFWDLAGLAERPLRTSTFTSLFPLLLSDLPAPIAARLVDQIEDPSDYGTAWPIPTVSRREPAFRPGAIGEHLIWRGAAWVNVNWYLCRGLRRHGRADLAGRIENSTATMVERWGFREYYDTLTGEGHGAPDFSWTALILDLLETRAAEA
ncbi:MAG TPA: trehalase family glycosidase [Candidatus Dormibacteraeota bacterium]|nr:trehalase family glycosidase [Candidatus Dormibacteraeota bacterium]